MRAVNLLPVAPARTRRSSTTRLMVLGTAGGAALAAVALATLYTDARSNVQDRNVTLTSLQARLAAATPARRALNVSEQQLASQQAPRISALNSALSNRVAWDRVLSRLALVLPDDVWLTALNAARPAPAVVATGTTGATASTAPAPAPIPITPGAATGAPSGTCAVSTGFCITGYTYTQPSVARLLARLAVIPAFANVELMSSSTPTPSGKPKLYVFTIHTDLSGQG